MVLSFILFRFNTIAPNVRKSGQSFLNVKEAFLLRQRLVTFYRGTKTDYPFVSMVSALLWISDVNLFVNALNIKY